MLSLRRGLNVISVIGSCVLLAAPPPLLLLWGDRSKSSSKLARCIPEPKYRNREDIAGDALLVVVGVVSPVLRLRLHMGHVTD